MQIRFFKFEERLEREICFKTIIFIIQKNTSVKLGEPTPLEVKSLKEAERDASGSNSDLTLTDFAWLRWTCIY